MDYDDFDLYPITPHRVVDNETVYRAIETTYFALQNLPSKSRVQAGEVSLSRLINEHLRLINNGGALFRQGSNVDSTLQMLWMTKVRFQANVTLTSSHVSKFEGLSEEDIIRIRALSKEPATLRDVKPLLAEHGIVLIYEPSLPSLKIDGAIFKLENGTPVVALSLRYHRYDYYWFTLMHELAHIVLHVDGLDGPIIDDFDESPSDLVELEANKLASDILIDPADWRTCRARVTRDLVDVVAFAKEIGTHPAVVAGRIQNEKKRFDLFSKLINEVNVREVLDE